MNERYDRDQIHKYWNNQAVKYGQSPSASWSDLMVMEMEIREILKYLQDGDEVLDIGCANGHSTINFALKKKVNIRGVDYIPEMIKQAKNKLIGVKKALLGSVDFQVGDITNLNETDDFYDKAIVIRVIINLADWQRQLASLRECSRIIKPGGLLLLSEATLQGWNRLNKFRNEWGLPDIPMPPFNLYLDQDKVKEELADTLELIELRNFSSTYYVATRVIKPLLAKVMKDVDAANPLMEWNRWFSLFPSLGDYGTQKLFIFRKK